MNDFDAIIAQAKRIVGVSRNIAAGVYPHGAELTCHKCGHRERASTEQAARYFSTGWPEHCGRTMTADSRPSHD